MQQQRLKLVVWHGLGYRLLLRSPHLALGQKLALLHRFLVVDWRLPHAHTPAEISYIVDAIFQPGHGVVVEAGCWNGGSTAKLSLACAMAGTSLHVFDSFAGVEPGSSHFSRAYAASLDSVRANVGRLGSISVCTFHPGWFCDTVGPGLATLEVKVVYIDCDLAKGTKEVLAAAVPSLTPGARVFTQDFHIAEVRRLLEDYKQWNRLGLPQPKVVYLCENTAELWFNAVDGDCAEPAVQIRSLTSADLADVAAVHRRAFSGHALTRLGPAIIRRYYDWQLNGPHDVAAYGAFVGPRLLGFVIAGRFHRAMSGFVNANRSQLAVRMVSRPWLLTNPLIRRRIHSAWCWVFRSRLPANKSPWERASFGVLSIAVDPSARRRGVGRSLMLAVEEAAVTRGLLHLHLTVEGDNHGALSFYERLGWRRQPGSGDRHGEMYKELPRQSQPIQL